MRPKVYLETIVPSYLTAWTSRDLVMAAHQQITSEWWNNRRADFDLFVSQLVLQEAAVGDPDAATRRMALLRDIPTLAGPPSAFAGAGRAGGVNRCNPTRLLGGACRPRGLWPAVRLRPSRDLP
jgi:hypothetical protein